MKKSRTKLFAALHQLHQERRRLVHRLKREREFAIGTVSVVNRKCGNPNCRCVEGPGHPQTLFLFKDEKTGRRKCKLVRRADEARMLRAGEHYRQFRDDMKKLRAIDLEEKRILMALAEERAIHYE
jgi:hypothetical protein